MTTNTMSIFGAIVATSLVAHAGSVVGWNLPTSGDWSSAFNWNPMVVPGISDDVLVGFGGGYTVTVSNEEFAGSLSITNPNVNLTINNAQSLGLYGDLVNEGLILINPVSGASETSLFFGANAMLSGSGSIVLNGFGPRASLSSGDVVTSGEEVVLTQGAMHTISGQGQIDARLINNGLVSADVVNTQMVLMGNPKTNNATMQAINGSVLDISGITLTQGLDGVLRAQGLDSEVQLTGSTVSGGSLQGSDGGGVSVTNASTLDGVVADCEIKVVNSHILNVRNSLINNSLITVNPVSGGSETSLVFLDSSSLEGEGTVVLNAFGARARLETAEGQVLVHGQDHTIAGLGQIEAAMINNGLVSANVPALGLELITNPKTNNAVFQAVHGGELNITGVTITQAPDALIQAVGIDSKIIFGASMIVGGSVETAQGGQALVTCATTFEDVDFFGDLSIGASHRLRLKEGTLNNGFIVVNPVGSELITTVEWADEMILEGSGVIQLAGSGARSELIAGIDVTRAGIGADQRLEGIGRIAIDFINHGTIAPGFSVGLMAATQPIEFTDSAVFEAQVNIADADLLRSSSTVDLNGTLNVLFIDGFNPEGFWARTIIEGSLISGEFDSVNIPAPPMGYVTRILNNGSSYRIGQTCPADLDLDGQLTFFDVSGFLGAYNAMDPIADLNGDERFNFFDVALFMDQFSAGCAF